MIVNEGNPEEDGFWDFFEGWFLWSLIIEWYVWLIECMQGNWNVCGVYSFWIYFFSIFQKTFIRGNDDGRLLIERTGEARRTLLAELKFLDFSCEIFQKIFTKNKHCAHYTGIIFIMRCIYIAGKMESGNNANLLYRMERHLQRDRFQFGHNSLSFLFYSRIFFLAEKLEKR